MNLVAVLNWGVLATCALACLMLWGNGNLKEVIGGRIWLLYVWFVAFFIHLSVLLLAESVWLLSPPSLSATVLLVATYLVIRAGTANRPNIRRGRRDR